MLRVTSKMLFTETARPTLDKAKCPAGQLGCSNKQCLPVEKFCDGHSDWYVHLEDVLQIFDWVFQS